jgi:YjbE family integral membrane protein
MEGAGVAGSLGALLQILFLDLLLSGDNALVIALACRHLPPKQARRAALLGAGGAILFRLILTLMAGALMRLPLLQIFSALPLLVIALNLMQEDGGDETPAARSGDSGMVAAAGVIIVSDAAMSLDNVVALAAVSGGNAWLLAFGLAFSVPLIVFGSFGFTRLMQAFPLLTDVGGALLGWVAGGMIVADPLIADWARDQAPALGVAMPLACAIFVLVQGRFARQRAAAAPRRVVAPLKAAPEKPAPPPRRVEPAIHPVAEAAPQDAQEQTQDGDRWMAMGLAALFLVFGLFLTAMILISD